VSVLALILTTLGIRIPLVGMPTGQTGSGRPVTASTGSVALAVEVGNHPSGTGLPIVRVPSVTGASPHTTTLAGGELLAGRSPNVAGGSRPRGRLPVRQEVLSRSSEAGWSSRGPPRRLEWRR
jgi:hypothetical protein